MPTYAVGRPKANKEAARIFGRTQKQPWAKNRTICSFFLANPKVYKPFQQPRRKTLILLCTNRETRMFFKELGKLKGQRVLVLRTQKMQPLHKGDAKANGEQVGGLGSDPKATKAKATD